jgi:hypothetical protein
MRLLLIAYLAPIPAALVLFLMLLAGYGFPLALTACSAVVLVPFAIAVGYASYGGMTKVYLWGSKKCPWRNDFLQSVAASGGRRSSIKLTHRAGLLIGWPPPILGRHKPSKQCG